MRSIQNLPIGRKLGIVARLSVLIALGVAVLTIFMTEVAKEIRRADEDGRVLSEIVADSAIPPLRFDDARVAASLLAALRHHERAVSYTHLDVYKRQRWPGRAGSCWARPCRSWRAGCGRHPGIHRPACA